MSTNLAALPHWAIAYPEITLAVGLLALFVVAIFAGQTKAHHIFKASLLLLLGVGVVIATQPFATHTSFNGLFVRDGFSQVIKLLIIGGSFGAMLLAMPFFKTLNEQKYEFPILMMLATTGMFVMVSANNFLTLYVGLELQSLALYVLAAFRREQPVCAEAGLKYFSLGALSSGIILFGLSLIYGFAGSTDYVALLNSLNGAGASPHGLLVGVGLTLAGLAFKLGAAPFHMWLPDVYEGVPTPVTAFFATAPKLAAFAVVTRLLLGPLAAFQTQWQPIILLLAVASMLVGAFGALTQKTLKRVLAYSSIGHSGFVLVALASGSTKALSAMVVYFALYMLMTLGAFALLLLLRQKDKSEWATDITSLAGFGKVAPTYAACFTIILFSMAGIPFLAGFFSKYYVLKTAIDADLAWLAVVGVLASVVSAGYYLRLIKAMYFDDAKIKTLHADGTLIYHAILGVSAFVMVGFILWPTGLEHLASLAAF